MNDAEFLDHIEYLARNKYVIDKDFKDRRIYLSAIQGWRLWRLVNPGSNLHMPSTLYRCCTILDSWLPQAREHLTNHIADKITGAV